MTTRCGIDTNCHPFSEPSNPSIRRIGFESYRRGAPRSSGRTFTLVEALTVMAVPPAGGGEDDGSFAGGVDAFSLAATVGRAVLGSAYFASTPLSGRTSHAAAR